MFITRSGKIAPRADWIWDKALRSLTLTSRRCTNIIFFKFSFTILLSVCSYDTRQKKKGGAEEWSSVKERLGLVNVDDNAIGAMFSGHNVIKS